MRMLAHRWSTILGNTGALGVSPADARYAEFLVGLFPMVCISIGGFLVYKAREKPTRVASKDIEEGKF
jgi:hypothetical protein